MTGNTLGRAAAISVLAAVASAKVLSADAVFLDNFEDGNAQDGMPVTWIPEPDDELAVDGGNLIVSGNVFAVASVFDLNLADTSIRTRFRLGDGDIIGVIARWNPELVETGYGGYVRADGGVGIDVTGAIEHLGFIPSTGLQPMQEDVMMQLDVIDDQISLWAWPAAEAMPTDPLLTANATIDSLTTGDIAVGGGFADFRNEPVETTFRVVHVADMHTPEPTAVAILMLGVACLIASRRKRFF